MNNQEKMKKIRGLAEELAFGRVFGEPLDSRQIKEMESKLGFSFPEEFKEFLKTFGSFSVMRMECIEGEAAVKETLDFRRNLPERFPDSLLIIEEDGYGNAYCLVCKGKDYGKVVFWQHDAPLEETYPKHPKGRPDFWLEGPNFWTWLLDKLQRIKKIEDEEKEGED